MSLAVVTMEGKYELICSLLNVAIFSDLDWAHSLKYSLQHCSWKYCFLWKHKSSVVHLSCLLLEFVCFWSLHIHCESKKLDPFSFEQNFGKYCPILIIPSLLQTEINYDQAYHKSDHHIWKLIQKTLEVLSLLRPVVHDTSKTEKNHLVYSSTPLGHGCNRSRILHPWPSGILE